jgi:hypothetical protein
MRDGLTNPSGDPTTPTARARAMKAAETTRTEKCIMRADRIARQGRKEKDKNGTKAAARENCLAFMEMRSHGH